MYNMKVSKKILIWTMLGLSALITWLTPIITAWFLIVDPSVTKVKGNAIFYFVAAIILLFGLKAFSRMIRKQKVNMFKHICITFLGLTKLLAVIAISRVIVINLEKIETFIVITSISYIIGKVIHLILVKKYKGYLLEIEVL